MSVLSTLFQDFAVRLCSTEFLYTARHLEQPSAFSCCWKLPMATLVAIILTGMRMSVQTELDTFFAHLHQQAQLLHVLSEQAFAQARRVAFSDHSRTPPQSGVRHRLESASHGPRYCSPNRLRQPSSARRADSPCRCPHRLLELIARKAYQHREKRLKPRNSGAKQHKKMTQKNC